MLYASPYSLVLSDKIEAKIIAHNAYGQSAESDIGGTALIVFVPSEPLSLANNPAITMGTSIGLLAHKWAELQSLTIKYGTIKEEEMTHSRF